MEVWFDWQPETLLITAEDRNNVTGIESGRTLTVRATSDNLRRSNPLQLTNDQPSRVVQMNC